MNRSPLLALALGAVLTAATATPAHAVDVGVSIGISQPGVYGRIDIGRFPQPGVVVAQPVVVAPVRVAPAVAVEPVYLWVPPGHRKQWHKHCHRYGACGVPVYFVADDWYQRHVLPHAAAKPHPHGNPQGNPHGHPRH